MRHPASQRADLVELALLAEEPLRGRRGRSRCKVAPPIEPTEPNLTNPEILQRLDGALDLDADRAAEDQVLLVRGRLVDHDLVRCPASCPATSVSVLNFGLDGSTREAEIRGAAEGDRLPVLDELRVLARDAADRVRDVRQSLHLRQQRLVEGGLGRP